MHNIIKTYRQIQSWENYFLCSAICSVGKALGSDIDDYHFYANYTGDNFAYLYPAEKGNPQNLFCDSGYTNSFFEPDAVRRAFAVFGYDCIYISSEQIKNDFPAVMAAIRDSVDRQIPVLAWGMGNVATRGGDFYNPLPEACLIGGYGEDNRLYVNLYMDADSLPENSIDEFGYSLISNGLNTVYGLFIAGDKLVNIDKKELYQNAINAIPRFFTAPSENNGAYVFGKEAFHLWADTLVTDDYFSSLTDEALSEVCWSLHLAPYCCICTSNACDFLKEAAEKYPDLQYAKELILLYAKMQAYRQEIWELQGGFYPPMEEFRKHSYRSQVAAILRKMGDLCDDILAVFNV